MKKVLTTVLFGVLSLFSSHCNGADDSIKTRFINFKSVVEKSKIGKLEQGNFETLKSQMEKVLEEKEKTLNELATKLDDGDYLDSISPEAETELKRKFRALSQEFGQHQNQYYQTLNQANYKVVQKLTDVVNQAADKVAKKNNIDMIVNEESTFYYNPKFDISEQVVTLLDDEFEKENKTTN